MSTTKANIAPNLRRSEHDADHYITAWPTEWRPEQDSNLQSVD